MFVLNTNQSGGGWYIISNENIKTFPDFKNSILFSLEWSTIVSLNSTPQTNGEVLDVNWTKVNQWNGTLVAPDYYTSVNDSGDILFWYSSWSAWSCSFRIWLDYKFNWWETIWKQIAAGVYWFYYIINGWFSRTVLWTLTVEPKLLHSDWTLTSIWTVQFSGTVSSSNSGTITSAVSTTERIKGVSTNWVVALADDILVVDYTYTCTSTSSTQYMSQYGVNLWKKFTRDWSHRYIPVQISIE